MTSSFDWFFLDSANIIVIFCLFLIVSPMGKIRLGGSDAKPDYTYVGWFAMLFAAGMAATIYHWGLHPWGIYAIVGLSLGLFCYN